MSNKNRINSQQRTEQILAALTVCQLDAAQLLKLSQTFDEPFNGKLYVLRKMNKLKKNGLVYEYTFPDRCKYWKLSREGYRHVYGPDKPIPTKPSVYRAIRPAVERHARRLADLLVQSQLAAFRSGAEIMYLYGDHQCSLKHDGATKVPDAIVGLKLRGRKTYTIVFELDCGTEPVYSQKSRDSLDQLIRFYLAHEASHDTSYRVVTVFERATVRVEHFLDRVEQNSQDSRRRVIKAVTLDRLLAYQNPLQEPILLDYDRQVSAMLPGNESVAQTIPAGILDSVAMAG